MVGINPDTILLNWLVALPFFAAAAAALLPRLAVQAHSEREAEALRRGPWTLAALTCLMGMAVCARLIMVTPGGARVIADYWWTRDLYHLRFQADVFSSVVACLIHLAGLLLCWHLFAAGDAARAHQCAPLLLIALGAAVGIALSADLLVLVFFLFLLVTPLWGLFRLAAPQAGNWFMGAAYLGGLLVLLAVLLAWQQAGDTSMVQLPLLLLTRPPGTLGVVAALALVGLLPLLPAVPGHGWLLALSASTPATGAVAALVAMAGGTVLLRLLPGLLLLPAIPGVSVLAILLGLATLWWGIARAWFAGDLRGRAAWATVSGSGYLLLALGEAGGPGGSAVFPAAAAVFLAATPLGLLAVWLSSSAVLARAGTDTLAGLSGLLRQMPSGGLGLLAGGLSVCGLPGTVGFHAQRALISGILAEGYWALAAAVIAADAALALIVIDSFRRAFLRGRPPALRPGLPALGAPLVLLTLGIMAAGVWGGPLVHWSESVARAALSLRP